MNVKRKTSPADAARFEQIKTQITTPETKARLQEATTTAEIRAIAGELGIDQQGRDMGKFISLLKLIGVDFIAMIHDEATQRREKLAEISADLHARAGGLPRVRLWSAAVESGADAESTGAFA
ncbi:hypothetical protein QR98_0007350, partial [Sarcoptes scabiei]